MKKSLFLLPLLAAFALCGCGDNGGGGSGGGGGGSGGGGGGGGGGGESGSVITLDFTDPMWKDEKITPFVKNNDEVLTFTYDDITYNDAGCYASVYNDTYWLMMKNKWEDGKVTENDSFAFFGNVDSYGSAIEKVVVTTSKQGGAVDLYVDFGDEAFDSFSCSGTKKSVNSSEITFTATNKGDSEYFAITAGKAVGEYRKNGGIAKVEIYLK